LLVGKALDEGVIAAACEEALRGAEPLSENGYKVPLAKGLLTRVLRGLA
jgi:xanthine dehydrogenase YagS FAD-binding subunit